MNIIIADHYEDMSRKAAEMMLNVIKNKKNPILGLATGDTPKGVYQHLVQDHKQHGTSYKNVTTFNLDEYVGISPLDPNSYHYFMNEQLFNHIDIPSEQVHLLNSEATEMEKECINYERLLQESGGIDLQLLGIGQNGHIGFNEPGGSFQSRTHIVELSESTREANSRFFSSMDEVPTHAITMGIASILESKQIILIASGEQKAEAIGKMINGEVDENLPASALQLHPNVTVIADRQALKLVK